MTTLLKRALWLLLCITLALPSTLAVAAPANVPARLPAQGANLLQNPGFEAPFGKQCCQTDLSKYLPNTPIDEVQVAAGWLGWWQAEDELHPGSCSTPGCIAWHRPEWREANCGQVCANRIRSGSNAQKYFTFYSVHDAGMFQSVGGITPGQRLQFSIYMQGWSTHADYGNSSGQGSMGMRVGIDPFGGTNPFSSNIIWSPVNDVYDAWGLYTIEAVARAGAVTVFTRSKPDWPLQHNDIYLDDASLVVVGTGSVPPGGPTTAPPAGPTPGAPAPAPTATQASGFIYTVVPGDHYYKIARAFGVSVASILAANPNATPNILRVGARLLIPGVSGPPGGGAGPSPTSVPNAPPAPTTSPIDQPGAFTYVVQRGDNLYRLSIRFNTTIARIKQLNGLVGDVIRIGQTLVIAPP